MKDKQIRCKAIVFPYPERAEIHNDVALPTVDDDSIVIKTKYSSISRGTEMDLYHARFHGRGQFYPILTGYEATGEVIYAGKNVTHLRVGDRAAASNLLEGFDKRYCVAWGGQTEYVVVNKVSYQDFGVHPDYGAKRACKIPDNISYQEACFSVLTAVALHGIERIGIKKEDTVIVIGQGCVGMLCAQIIKSMGIRVIVCDLYDYRLNISKKVGLKEQINVSDVDLVKQSLEYTEGKGADVVVDATGKGAEIYEFIWDMVKEHGTVHAQGMVLDPIVLKVCDTLFSKSLRFSSSCGEYPRHQREALSMISDGRIKVKEMISKEMFFTEATKAYDLVDKKPDEILKLIFKWEE